MKALQFLYLKLKDYFFSNDVKDKATNSTKPMKQMFEKARYKFIAESKINSSIDEIALS